RLCGRAQPEIKRSAAINGARKPRGNFSRRGQYRNRVFIFSLDGYSIHTTEGLDGEEIESVCELKGLTLRPTHAEFVCYTLPDQRRSSRKVEKQFLILEDQG